MQLIVSMAVKMEVHALYQKFAHVLKVGMELPVKLVRWWNIHAVTELILIFYDLKDIDECNGDHECDHNCTNIEGSYLCSCDPGFILQPDNRTCQGFI